MIYIHILTRTDRLFVAGTALHLPAEHALAACASAAAIVGSAASTTSLNIAPRELDVMLCNFFQKKMR